MSHVNAVVMNIGEVSTIVPDYLTDCWRWAADKEDMLRGCELRIHTSPAVTHCDGCGSENTWLLRGNEVEIKEIEV